MKPFSLLLFAALAAVAWSEVPQGRSDEEFQAPLAHPGSVVSPGSKAAAARSARGEEWPRYPEEHPCIEYGTHTDRAPTWRLDPLHNTCLVDPLKDPAALEAAFDKVMAKVRTEDTRPPFGPYDDIFPRGSVSYKKGILRGAARPGLIDYSSHWADAAEVRLKIDKAGAFMVVGGALKTVRANRVPGREEDQLDGYRVDCYFGSAGALSSVDVYRGLRMVGSKEMSWYGPTTEGGNRREDLEGPWSIRCHQLLKHWADEENTELAFADIDAWKKL